MLPPESVVVLNIPYWGAGVQPWCLGSGHKDFPHAPSISDQKLEVFCVYSSFHIAQMQVKNLTTYVTLFIYWAKPLETRQSKQGECRIYVLEKLLLDIVVGDHLFFQILQIVALENYFRLLSLIMFWIFQIVLQGNFFEIVDLDHSFQTIQMSGQHFCPCESFLFANFYKLSIWATFLQILVKFCTLSFRSTFICQLSCFESLFCKLFVVDHLLQTLKVVVLLNFFVNCRSGQFFFANYCCGSFFSPILHFVAPDNLQFSQIRVPKNFLKPSFQTGDKGQGGPGGQGSPGFF